MRGNLATYINRLSASEGVFTTAQADRVGVSRSALAKACASGKLVRIAHGAYRSAAVTSSQADEITAAWKLTAPSKMLHERMRRDDWDGVVVGGATAASLTGIGDFFLTPIRMYSPERIKPRNPDVKVSVRSVDWEDVGYEHGFAVTKMERTIVDLLLDDEDLSLVRSAYDDALNAGLNHMRLKQVVSGLSSRMKAKVMRAFEEGGIEWDPALGEWV